MHKNATEVNLCKRFSKAPNSILIDLDGERLKKNTFDTIEKANWFLSKEAYNPPPPGGAYDKVNYRIVFENGPNGEEASMSGRLDLHNNMVGRTLTNYLLGKNKRLSR